MTLHEEWSGNAFICRSWFCAKGAFLTYPFLHPFESKSIFFIYRLSLSL